MGRSRNAKAELKELLSEPEMASILAAEVSFDPNYEYEEEPSHVLTLPMGFSAKEEQNLWAFLDRTYDAGWGSQKLFGTIWLQDGSWLTRGEYDGSEWWNHNKRPAIPRRKG